MQRWVFTFAALAVLCNRVPASTLTFDELGHGTTGVGVLAPDPGPGGLPAVLTYSLGFAVVPGDVLLFDGTLPLDVLRFNEPAAGGPGTLVFYSDNTDGFDAPADTVRPPTGLYSNVVNLQELGTETDNGALYTPGPNNPGYAAGAIPVTYHFISDTPVPEPALSGLSLFGGLALLRRSRRNSAPLRDSAPSA